MQAEEEVCKQKLRKLCKAFPSFLFPPLKEFTCSVTMGQYAFPSFLLDQISL